MFPSPVAFYSPVFFYLALIWHDGHLLLVTSCHHSWFLSLEQTTRAYFFPINLLYKWIGGKDNAKRIFLSQPAVRPMYIAREHQSLDMSLRDQL